MTSAPTACAAHERPVYIPVGDDHAFAIVTEPTVTPSGIGVLLLAGGVYVLSTNRNRMFVTIARALAGHGHRVLRLDYRGVGESTGVIGDYALDMSTVPDVEAAADWLVATGTRGLAVVGSCYGARAAMHTLSDHTQLRAAVLLAPPLGDAGRGDVETPDDVGRLFLSEVVVLRTRRVPVLFVYGEQDAYWEHFRTVYPTALRPLFENDSPLSVRTVPGELHSLSHVAAQEMFTQTALSWLPDVLDHVSMNSL